MATATTKKKTYHQGSYVHPDALYTIRHFQIVTGISALKIREARQAGVDLPVLTVANRRKFVRGLDGIQYIERLARL